MACNRADIPCPLVKRFEVAVSIEELSSHVLTHLMHLEGGKHLVGVSEVLQEELIVCRWCLRLRKSLYGSFIDDTQHLTPDVRLNLV